MKIKKDTNHGIYEACSKKLKKKYWYFNRKGKDKDRVFFFFFVRDTYA